MYGPFLHMLTAYHSTNSSLAFQRGSFQMPGRTKMTEMVDELYAAMMVKLKALLQQSTSVSLTTDTAKMPTGDSYVAVTAAGHWISSDWELLSAVLGVSISNVSHTA